LAYIINDGRENRITRLIVCKVFINVTILQVGAYNKPSVIFILTLHMWRFIKRFRISAGHMCETRMNDYQILVGKHKGKSPLGMAIPGRHDDIKMGLTEIMYEDVEWTDLNQYTRFQ
jgi:hypothetical protein